MSDIIIGLDTLTGVNMVRFQKADRTKYVGFWDPQNFTSKVVSAATSDPIDWTDRNTPPEGIALSAVATGTQLISAGNCCVMGTFTARFDGYVCRTPDDATPIYFNGYSSGPLNMTRFYYNSNLVEDEQVAIGNDGTFELATLENGKQEVRISCNFGTIGTFWNIINPQTFPNAYIHITNRSVQFNFTEGVSPNP